MDTLQHNQFDIFRGRIYQYLKDYFPHLFENLQDVEDMVSSRTLKAQTAYSKCINQGENHIEAMEYANKILHADLEFSPISYLQKVYENKTGKILSDEQAVSIYKNTKPIFDKYGKDIEGSDEECLLIEELTPLLQ